MLDANTAAERQYQSDLEHAHRVYQNFCAEHPLESYEDRAWDNFWNEGSFEAFGQITDDYSGNTLDAVKRLVCFAVDGHEGLVPDYGENQHVRDYGLIQGRIREWVREEAIRLRNADYERRMRA